MPPNTEVKRSEKNADYERKATFDHEPEPEPDAASQEEHDDAHVHKQKSRNSLHSNHSNASSSDSRNQGKEMPDRFQYKIAHMNFLIIAIVANALLLALTTSLSSPEGFYVSFITDFIGNQETILYFILSILVFSATAAGLNKAAHAFFGYWYASEHGYSLTAFGFFRGGVFHKLTFTDRLSLRSSCRKLLSRVSYIWLLQTASIVLAAYAVHGIVASSQRSDEGTLSCLIYGQDGNIYDRSWPNFDAEIGVAEYVFGTSLGHMRSQEAVNVTTFVMPPQLVDTCNDGTTIKGLGYSIDITTSCSCAHSMDPEDLQNNDLIGSEELANDLYSKYNDDTKAYVSMINKVAMNGKTMEVHTALTRTYLCGGTNSSFPPVPVCKTTFSNHKRILVMAEYMTDGTPASIALKRVTILPDDPAQGTGSADIEKWFYPAMKNLLGGATSSKILSETIPGAACPILWWTTANMQAIGYAYVEAGLETTWSMLSRVAIQRSYSTKGNSCQKNVASSAVLVFNTTQDRAQIMYVFIGIQFFVQLISLLAYIPWLHSEYPIAAAIRLLDDPVYLTQMISNSQFAARLVPSNATTDTREMWAVYDKRIRLGETKNTQEDPEYGMLSLDKPRLVSHCQWGKLYS
jgi:hypothetical protein